MRYRKLDENGDYVIGTGSDFYKDSPEAVAQAVRTRLDLWKGEWFVNTGDGTPYQTDVLGKRFAGKNYDAVIKQRILQTQGVKEIVSYQSTFNGDSRKLEIQATINTIYGQTTVQGVL